MEKRSESTWGCSFGPNTISSNFSVPTVRAQQTLKGRSRLLFSCLIERLTSLNEGLLTVCMPQRDKMPKFLAPRKVRIPNLNNIKNSNIYQKDKRRKGREENEGRECKGESDGGGETGGFFRLTQVCVPYHSGPGTGHVVQNPRYSASLAEIL